MSQLGEDNNVLKQDKSYILDCFEKLFDKYKIVTANMKDLAQSVLDTTKERIKNPFVGSYIISFVVIHWKPILYLLFSSSSIEMKLCVIQEEYASNVCFSFLIPLVIALVYVIGLPYINDACDFLTTKARDSKIGRQHLLNMTVLENRCETAEKENEIARTLAETDDIKELTEKKKQLENENTNKENELTLLRQENNNLKKFQKAFMLVTAENDNFMEIWRYITIEEKMLSDNQIDQMKRHGIPLDKIEYDLKALMKKAEIIEIQDSKAKFSRKIYSILD